MDAGSARCPRPTWRSKLLGDAHADRTPSCDGQHHGVQQLGACGMLRHEKMEMDSKQLQSGAA